MLVAHVGLILKAAQYIHGSLMWDGRAHALPSVAAYSATRVPQPPALREADRSVFLRAFECSTGGAKGHA
jgi:hypothetical protein